MNNKIYEKKLNELRNFLIEKGSLTEEELYKIGLSVCNVENPTKENIQSIIDSLKKLDNKDNDLEIFDMNF